MQNVQRGIYQIFASMMDVLVIFRTLNMDLKNPQFTTSIAFIFLEFTQTSQA
jgi:hypothetical protein